MKKNNGYVGAILFSLLFYTISSFIGSFENVFIGYATGLQDYANWTENSYALLSSLLFSIINHVLFSWITVSVVNKYANKHDCNKISLYFVSALIVVIYALVFNPLLFGKSAGFLSYILQSICIILFGFGYMRNNKKSIDVNTPSFEEVSDATEYDCCPHCGKPLMAEYNFCEYCGTPILK